jgi:hypothetical protein
MTTISRRRTRLMGLATLVAATLSLWTSTAGAIERKPLPVFEVFTPEGSAAESRQLSQEPQWLIIYTTADCASCDRLLDALEHWQSPQLLARTVVIVGGHPSVVGPYLQRRRDASAVAISFYSDAQGQAWQTLALTGIPVLLGVRAGQLEWSLSGVLNDPSALESVVRKWVEY